MRVWVGPVPYRGIQPIVQPTPMGHEYCGIVEDIGSEVTSIKPGQFVIGSFFGSDNTCPNCQVGYQSSLAAENHTELGFWRVSTNSINRLAKSTEASRG